MSKAKTETQELTYNSAMLELKKIIESIEQGDVKIDALSTNLERANFLVIYCQQKLRTIEGSISESEA